MRRLSPGSLALIAAWLIVLGALGGVVGYGLLHPPPPPIDEAVSVALPPPPDPLVDTPPADPVAEEDAPQETPADSQGDGAADAVASLPETESPEPESQEAQPPEAQPAEAAEPETAGEAAPAETDSPEAAEAPAAAAPAAESEAVIAVPLPKPRPPEQPAGETAEARGEPTQEQVVNVPIVPPSPEDLPYWERYRQPFNTEDTRPRIAVVLTGLGLSDSATQAAIDSLPPAITLSFSPYARGLERWIALARARGHEVMLDLPMEPTTFPSEDPGPQALLTGLSAEDNLDRLDWVLSRGSAYVGVAGSMGSRFTASRAPMETVLTELKSRGLIFLDNRTTDKSLAPSIAAEIGLHAAFNNRSIDERQASRVAIDARLAQIERIALSEGFAVAMAQPYPVTLDRLASWSTELTARGYVIAPISALVDRQERP